MEPRIVVPEPPREERPRSVTVVGWTFLVLSSLRFLEDVWGWAIWKLGNPEPVIRFFLPRGEVGAMPRWVMAHFLTVVAVQGAVALCVAVISWNFLRLRAWARPALEIVCWLAMALVTGIAGLVGYESARFGEAVTVRQLSFYFAILLADLVIAGVIWTIRSPRVRDAFRSSQDRTS